MPSKKELNYIKKQYLSKTAVEIANDLGYQPWEIRVFAKKVGVSKRIRVVGYKNFNLIPGFSKYGISRRGMVVNMETGKLIKPTKTEDDYYRVKLNDNNGIRRAMLIHRLVAMTYIPNPNNLPEVNHLNGKEDSSAESLEWITREGNQQHAYDTGLKKGMKGSTNPNASHSNEVVHEICKLLEMGYNNKDIISRLNISANVVSNIKTKRHWKHISSQYNI